MTPGELFENAINHWRDAKGIGTALIPTFLNDKVMVLGVLQRVYARSPSCKTVIITSNLFLSLKRFLGIISSRVNQGNILRITLSSF